MISRSKVYNYYESCLNIEHDSFLRLKGKDSVTVFCSFCKKSFIKTVSSLLLAYKTNKTSNIYCSSFCCSSTQKMTKESFIKLSEKVHTLDKYSFNSPLTLSKEHMTITCKIHGDFSVTPNNFLRGYGCPTCGKLSGGFSCKDWEKSAKNSANFDSFKVYIIECFNDTERFIKIRKIF